MVLQHFAVADMGLSAGLALSEEDLFEETVPVLFPHFQGILEMTRAAAAVLLPFAFGIQHHRFQLGGGGQQSDMHGLLRKRFLEDDLLVAEKAHHQGRDQAGG